MPNFPKSRKVALSKYELKKYKKTLWPAKPVEDAAELREWLEEEFFGVGDFHGDREENQWKNFSAYTRKARGWGWINALHSFDEENPEKKETPLTFVLDRAPDEWRFVSFLLEVGADPNIRNGRGEPPLLIFINNEALMRRHRTFALLMQNGADATAEYKGKNMAEYADIRKDEDDDQVSEWVAEDLSHLIPNSERNEERQRSDEQKRSHAAFIASYFGDESD
ncbi:MAG: hypothetical protein SGILL_005931 [Bacillariaceae sp.]